jgi:Flp pilus assembly pilin Flp
MGRLLDTVVREAFRDDGQDLMEYALLAALVALVAVAGVRTVGDAANNVLWQYIVQSF